MARCVKMARSLSRSWTRHLWLGDLEAGQVTVSPFTVNLEVRLSLPQRERK